MIGTITATVFRNLPAKTLKTIPSRCSAAQLSTTSPTTTVQNTPTSTGYLAIKDITPRPPYGPACHPRYPILLMKHIHTNTETPYMILGYTGKTADAVTDILKNGPSIRIFSTLSYNHATQYADSGNVLTLGIPLDKFITLANGYSNTSHTEKDVLNDPSVCVAIQGDQNVCGFEIDDHSEGFRETQSYYTPLRALITRSSTVLDVKDPEAPKKNSLDQAIIDDKEKTTRYYKDTNIWYQLRPQWLNTFLERPDTFEK
jgi:hypothetical protein